MSFQVSVAMVGIGGYGDKYLAALLDNPLEDGFRLIGVVDPVPEKSRHLEQIRARRIPVYPDLERLYERECPDLVMMATPIHLHAAHTRFALERGSNVLCEKPAGARGRNATRNRRYPLLRIACGVNGRRAASNCRRW
jgi:predicted dehydrogenase